MNVALIGKQQDINTLSQEIKENDFFRLVGTYFSDSKALKVNRSSIISPFGLINHCDGVIFQKNDDHSFNLMIEAVKSSKSLLIINPHDLTLEETEELLKISEEAETEIFVCSHYKLNTALSQMFPELEECKLWDVVFESSDVASGGNQHAMTFEMAHLIDMVLSFSNAGMRKFNVVVLPFESKEFVELTMEFDNGKIALMRFNGLSKKQFLEVKGYSDKKIFEIFPNEYKASIGSMTESSTVESRTFKLNAHWKSMLHEFSNVMQSERSLLTRISDFQKTQNILKTIKEKKDLLQ